MQTGILVEHMFASTFKPAKNTKNGLKFYSIRSRDDPVTGFLHYRIQHTMNPRVEAKIKALCARTGLLMKQENGQRKYTNPALLGKPEKGTEIFIGKLPRDLFEDELVPVLEQYGP